jgi:hypothetical protein
LENTDESLRLKEKELLQLQKKMNDQIKGFNKYPEPFYSFLNEYLGLYKGELILAKGLNVNWQQILQKQEVIVYDEKLYVYFLKDFGAFIESLKARHERGLKYHWDPDEDIEKAAKSSPWTEVSYDGKYKLPSEFSDPFIHSIKKVDQELNKIQQMKLTVEQELKRMKNRTVQSYMEMAEVSNYLSTADLKKHKELQDKALKWLFQRGFVAVTEFTLPNGKKADIFAFNEYQIIIFEIKVSYGDLMTDLKWIEYLPYCHDFYFLTPPNLKPSVEEKIKEVNCGQYVETESSIRIIKADERKMKKVEQENELKFAAAQLLSRKHIYGF